jgi:2-hydroxychromene-2-carboxylate isomerase
MMDLIVELYWSFRSPYSYIVLPRVIELRDKFRVSIDLRIVHPAAIRNPSYFARMDPLARPYFMKDSARAAAFHGLTFRRPIPDPIEQDPKTLAIAKEQPHARRLGRLGIAANERGRGLEFSREVSALLWDGGVSGWDQGTHLAGAATRAGLTFLSSKTQSSQIQKDMRRALPRTIAPCGGRDTGEFLLWCTRANRSSGKIGSTCLFGD